MKKADHAEADQNNVGTHQGYDMEAGKKEMKGREHYENEYFASDEWENSDARKEYHANAKSYIDGGMDPDDAKKKADKEFWAGDAGKEIKANAQEKNQRDYAWGSTPNMSNLVKRRNELRDSGDTSSKEYQEIQNRINHAYSNEKRHGETTTTKSSKD